MSIRAALLTSVLSVGSALSRGFPTALPAQELELAPVGQLGLVVLDQRLGAAIGLGPRLVWKRLVAVGVGEMALIGNGGDDAYTWATGPEGERECRERGGDLVGDGFCLEAELRVAAMVDAVVVTGSRRGPQGLVGGGYRVSDESTPYLVVGVLGRWGGRASPWQARALVGRRFSQLHVAPTTGQRP